MRPVTKLFLPTMLLSALLAGCATRQTVTVPPRIDLGAHEMIGVIEFTSSSDGELGSMATERFTELARRDQGPVRMVDFGSKEEALSSVDAETFDSEVFRSLGIKRGVRTILTGELTVSDVRPDVSVAASLRSGTISGKVEATLRVRLIEAATGASIWSRSASITRSVGHISVFDGGFSFDAEDPHDAYGELVNSLVGQVTRDFRVTYERR